MDPGTADGLKTAYRKYRELVYKSLRKAEIIDDPEKRRRLEDALPFKGICEEMCPEYEQIQRIAEHDVMSEEKDDGKFDRSRMVKKFGRSAAGQDAPLPQDVRSVDALRRTTDYLFNDLLNGENLAKIHNFLWDRTRAVRRDFTFHSQKSPEEMKDLVYCFESITRFHAVALHLLSQKGVGKADFDYKQEIEQLGRTILSLMEAYDACREMNVTCENEAEFRAYYLLLNAQDPSIAQRIPSWGKEFWFDSEEVQTALSLVNAMDDVREPKGPIKPKRETTLSDAGFANYFSIVENPKVSYTMACVAEIHFTTVRQDILKNLVRGYARNRDAPRTVTAEDLNGLLKFDTVEEAEEFAKEHDFVFSTEYPPGKPPPAAPYLVLNDRRKHIPSPRIPQAYSGKLVERKRHGQSVSYAIYNTIFEEVSEKPGTDSPDSLFVTQDEVTMDMAPAPQPSSPQVAVPSLPGSPFGTPAAIPSPFQFSVPPTAAVAKPTLPNVVDPFVDPQGGNNASPFANPFQGAKPSLFESPVQQNKASPFQSPIQNNKPSPFGSPMPGSKSNQVGSTLQGSHIPEKPAQPASPAAPSTSILSPVRQPSQFEKPTQPSPFAGATPSPVATQPEPNGPKTSNPFAPTDDPTKQPSQIVDQPRPNFTSIFGQNQSSAPSPAVPGAAANLPLPAVQKPLPTFSAPVPSIGGEQVAAGPPATQNVLPPAQPSVLARPSPASMSSGPPQLGPVTSTTTASLLKPSPASALPGFAQLREVAAPSPAATPSPASNFGIGAHGTDAGGRQQPSLFQPAQPAQVLTVPPPAAAPERDLMGDFAKWFAVGDQGVMEQWTEHVVSELVAQAFDRWVREEEEKRRRAEDDESWREARAYRTHSLGVKYFYQWREAARDLATKRILFQGRDKMRAYREQKMLEKKAAKEKAAQAEQEARREARRKLAADRLELSMMASAGLERRVDTEEQLLASGIFKGFPNERAVARRVMRDVDNGTWASTSGYQPYGYAESDLALEPRRPASSTRGPTFTPDSSVFKPEKAEGWKTRSLREKFGLNHKRSRSAGSSVTGSSRHRQSLPSTKTTNFSRKRSADESSEEGRDPKRKQQPSLTNGFKTAHWDMRRRGFVLMPNGQYIPESLAKKMREGKRYPGLGDFGLDSESVAQGSVADYEIESVVDDNDNDNDDDGISASSLQLRLAQLRRSAGMDTYDYRSRSRSVSYVDSPPVGVTKRKRHAAAEPMETDSPSSPSAQKKSHISREESQSMLANVQKMVGELKEAMDVLDGDRAFFREQSGILGDES
ncbi:hypothetical protein OQA88_6421 [Cercophora sp. LCS_1]